MDRPPEVTFARSGITVPWDPAYGSLLELARGVGLTPPWSCREGGCNSCLTRLLVGEVEYTRELLLPPPSGNVLLCCARPKGRIVLEL